MWLPPIAAVALALAVAVAAGCRALGTAGRDRPARGAWGSGAAELLLRETAGYERKAEPVFTGLPFPAGALPSAANLRVLASDGRELPSQRSVLATWPDGSVRWAGLAFEPGVAAGATGRYRVEFGPRVKAGRVPAPLMAESQKDLIRVDTGRLQLEVLVRPQPHTAGAQPALTLSVDLNGDGRYDADERVLAAPGLEVFAELEALKPGAVAGRFSAAAGAGAAELEEAGPLRACVAWRGWHVDAAGRRTCPFLVRIYAFRGRSCLRVVHTLTLSEDPNASRLVEAGLALAPAAPAAPAGRALRQTLAAPKRYPDLAGFEVRTAWADGERAGAEGRPGAHLAAAAGRCEVILAPARPVEDAPWELRVEPDGSRLTAALWPRWDPESTDARGPEERAAPGFAEFCHTESFERFWPRGGRPSSAAGAARSHELWVDFAAVAAGAGGGTRAADFAARAAAPLAAWPGAEWLDRSGAFGRFAPAGGAGDGDSGGQMGVGLSRLSEWLAGHQRGRFGWLGLWDYGDFQTVYRERGGLNVGERWWNWSGTWGWMQDRDGLTDAFLAAWLRRGDPADWERFRAAAEHAFDVDTVHDAGRGAGLTGTSHGPGASHWSAPASLAATWPAAWLDHHYLTGERRGLEALVALAGSLEGRGPADFADRSRAWSPEQAGLLRARLAAREALGGSQEAAAQAALEFFDALSARELGSEGWARELAPALIRHHRLTGSEIAARLIERGTRGYLASRGPAARGSEVERNCYDSCAYAWRLSGDSYFLERGRVLLERSAAARAGRVPLDPGSKVPADLSTDTRELLELFSVPALLAAEQEAGLAPLAPPGAAAAKP
ncbi:MAG TPA: hypothetical protein PK280_12455 [Planctomycetota bacterium]|nr:hypothetical protein [Planctomycetota bacterium]